MFNTLVSTALSASLLLTPVKGYSFLAAESINLDNRYPVESVSKGFKENILIALGYLASQGEALQQGEALRDGFSLKLMPGDVFAFHNKGILPQYVSDKIITQESDFTTRTGYKVVAGLGGNGVCHLASLINWTASEAGLEVASPTSHNFAKIPGIDEIYGTSISTRNSPAKQNLYVRNTFDFPIRFKFIVEDNLLVLVITSERF